MVGPKQSTKIEVVAKFLEIASLDYTRFMGHGVCNGIDDLGRQYKFRYAYRGCFGKCIYVVPTPSVGLRTSMVTMVSRN